MRRFFPALSFRFGCFCLFAICAISHNAIMGQAIDSPDFKWRMVQVENLSPDDPVAILAVQLSGKPIRPGEPFRASDDWLSQLSVLVVNKSSKRLVAGRVQFGFPDTASNRSGSAAYAPVALQKLMGVPPRKHRIDINGNEMVLPDSRKINILPGQTIGFSLKDNIPAIRQELTNIQSNGPVTRCWLHLLTFYFDDGTSWEPGAYHLPMPIGQPDSRVSSIEFKQAK
jgi:hypothetical protein